MPQEQHGYERRHGHSAHQQGGVGPAHSDPRSGRKGGPGIQGTLIWIGGPSSFMVKAVWSAREVPRLHDMVVSPLLSLFIA